ncbi:MAG: CCA tRNA nucleotidyltransferase, partial [Bacilli bacterium]|nr:CCA tRNA nucleotidyltransferase [Bacilli bacterium]
MVEVTDVLKKIEDNGFEAYVVGGYVRDQLLGIVSTDIDICTNARVKD